MSLMTSPSDAEPVLQGAQRPRILSVPEYSSSTGAEAIEFCELAGLQLDPWQEFVLAESLGERDDHKWAAFEVGLVVARQNGKTELLVARTLVGLFLLGERLIIHSAHQFDTAMEAFRRLVFVIEDNPRLKARVKLNRGRVGQYSHGNEGIELLSGQRLRYKARQSGGAGRGFTCDCLILDEAMILSDSTIGSILPTLSSRPNPQVLYAGSAVDQQEHFDGLVLSRLRARGVAGGDPSLAWFEWSAPGDHPEDAKATFLDNPAAWAQANPGMGIRIAPDYIERERRALSPRTFAVERLGIGDWPDVTEEAGRIIPSSLWHQLADEEAALWTELEQPVFAIDTNVDQSWGAIAVAGIRDDGLWQVAIVRHDRGSDWIADGLENVLQAGSDAYAPVIVDPRGPAANLLPDVKQVAFEVIEPSTRDYGDACADFVNAASQRVFRYQVPETDVDEALSGARQQAMGDRWKWARRSSASPDISPLVAVTLALWGVRSAKQYANVFFGDEDESPVDSAVAVSDVPSPNEYTTCFRCATGSYCPDHQGGE